jgi:hypothetical protein
LGGCSVFRQRFFGAQRPRAKRAGRGRRPRSGRSAPTEKGLFWNLSIVGKKYTDAFNIKGQKADLWSGCSGIGLER